MPTSDRRNRARRAEDQLAAWQRWQIASLDAAAPAPGAAGATAAARQADQAEAPAHAAAQVPTAAEIDAMFDKARQAGYAAGQAQAKDEARRLAALASALDAALAAFEQRVADDVLALSVEIARQVVRQAVTVKPETIVEVIREALAQMPHGHAVIQLHPEDASLARSYLGEQLAHLGHRILEDPAAARGGCVVEANGSQLDATLAMRWKRVVEAAGAKGDWIDAPGH